MSNSFNYWLNTRFKFLPQIPQARKRTFPPQVQLLATIELELLKADNIRGIILDLDNTILSEDDSFISPGGEAWIQAAKSAGFKLFVLSNGKRAARVQLWAKRLAVPAISPAIKPFPFAFRRALKEMNLSAKEVVVIGDSRHTDILGAWLVGCTSIQVASLPHLARWWERIAGKYIQTPYHGDY